MKRRLAWCLSFAGLLTIACQSGDQQGQAGHALPRIAIAGLAIESSTFSPARTEVEAFHPTRGDEILEAYAFLGQGSRHRERAEWIPTLRGRALPGGMVTREAYESLVKETLERLGEGAPYDGLFFDIHGAMSVEGLDDPEGDFIERIRDVIGTETLISTSMDLHGNVSERLARHTDLITCYRMAPHEDASESRERAVDNLLTRIESGEGKPAFKAWIPVPILLPGEKTSTRIEPGKSLYAKVAPASRRPGVIDAAIWIGYAWADEPRNHAVVMVTGDEETAVTDAAEELARAFWNARHDFEFVAPTATLEESLDMALASDEHPFLISDMGDNPTAGGAGDVTWTLTEILKRPELGAEDGPSLIYASLPGPELVRAAERSRRGRQRLRAGRRRHRCPLRAADPPDGNGRGYRARRPTRRDRGRREDRKRPCDRDQEAEAVPPRVGLHPPGPEPEGRRRRGGQDRLPRSRAL